MTIRYYNRALEMLTEAHASGGTVHTLLSTGKLQEWPPNKEFDPTEIVFLPETRRQTISTWLDCVTRKIGPSRADGWIGTFNIDRSEGRIRVFVGWFQDPTPVMGPVMSFGAAFLDHESWYSAHVRELFMREHRQLTIDSLIKLQEPEE